jgi:lipoyl(octanoyl) transferase
MFKRLIWVIDETPHPAPLNMAIDEALLTAGGDCPLFRAYRWLRRPVSIGYFSSWEQAIMKYPDREIVRRWTGGGMVEHGDDFTYSLLFPINAGPPSNRDLYREVHTSIVQTLAANGCSAATAKPLPLRIELTPLDRHDSGKLPVTSQNPVAACFERSVEDDVEVDGVKVAGAAIRRLRIGVILQGSVQRISIDPGFANKLTERLAPSVEKRMLSPVTTLLAERIANEKYGTESWTRRY